MDLDNHVHSCPISSLNPGDKNVGTFLPYFFNYRYFVFVYTLHHELV